MPEKITQLAKQLLGIWKELGINQKISIVTTALVVICGMGALLYWSSKTDFALLYGRLDEAEAARVTAALDDAKIPYKIGRNGTAIFVPADKVYTTRMQLASKGIPKGDGVGFEIFDKPNFGLSDFVQRANYVRAIQGELARTIAQLDEVEAARVMIVMPENRLLADKTKKASASVFVKVRGQTALPQSSVNAIRFLVANSVEGLQPNNVMVVDNLGNVLSDNTETDSPMGLSVTQLAIRKNLEAYLSKKVEDMLDKVLGQGQAVVRVAADINFDTINRTEEKFDPDGQVIRTQTINDEKTDTTASQNGGVPGVATNANTDTNSTAQSTPVNITKVQKKVTNNEYEINRTTSTILQSPGSIKRLTAAVFIAAKVEGTGADRKIVQRTPEELNKLKRVVQNALGVDPTRQDDIALEEMPFNDQFTQEFNQIVQKEQRQKYWQEIGINVGYGILGLLILGIFFKLLKKTSTESIPLGVPIGTIDTGGNGYHHNGGEHKLVWPPPKGEPEVITVELLNQLVKENPANVTQAIKNWMNRGRSN
jgi:flagellar M-ring protein FliF